MDTLEVQNNFHDPYAQNYPTQKYPTQNYEWEGWQIWAEIIEKEIAELKRKIIQDRLEGQNWEIIEKQINSQFSQIFVQIGEGYSKK